MTAGYWFSKRIGLSPTGTDAPLIEVELPARSRYFTNELETDCVEVVQVPLRQVCESSQIICAE